MKSWNFILVLALALGGACVRRYPSGLPPMDVNLFLGIEQIARLGESESQIEARVKFKPSKEQPPIGLKNIGFTSMHHYKDLGVKVYFKGNRAALIEAQDPFQGSIQGKRLRLFSFAAPSGGTWEDEITKELGAPTVKASGGRLGSEGLFYAWGDISFNRNGPNEIAIYKDSEIAKFRQENFGRVVKFFKSN